MNKQQTKQEEIREGIAERIHLEWVDWSLNLDSNEKLSTEPFHLVTIEKKRKILRFYDPNKIIKTHSVIPKAYTKFELTQIMLNQTKWETFSVESYNEKTIEKIVEKLEINDSCIASGYPEFIRRQFEVSSSQ